MQTITIDDASHLSEFLTILTNATCNTGIRLFSGSTIRLPESEAILDLEWDDDLAEYKAREVQ